MRFKGQFKGIQRDWQTNIPLITLSVLEGQIDQLNDLSDTELSVEIKKFHKKKTLNQNSYMWELISKIAVHKDIKSTPEEVYEGYIQQMRLPYEDEDGYLIITVKASVDMSKIEGHWCFYEMSGDGRFISYYKLRGTSTYNTKEMSDLIDLIVEDAKELGIETLTPDEIARLEGIKNG